MKNVLKFIVFTLITFCPSIVGAQYFFTDVDTNTPHSQAISNMYEIGVFNGYPDGTFRPESCVSRAELLKIVYTYQSLEVNAGVGEAINANSFPQKTFIDTLSDQWYSPFINIAFGKGAISGYPDGTFRPLLCVNRAEAAKIFRMAMNYVSNTFAPIDYDDVPLNTWYYNFITILDHYELLSRDHVNSQAPYYFRPADPMPRHEIAEMLNRAWAKKYELPRYNCRTEENGDVTCS